MVVDLGDAGAYALEVGKALAPIYRAGDRLILSPAARVRPGARVVVRLKRGMTMAREFVRRSKAAVTVKPLMGGQAVQLPASGVEFVHRIVAVMIS